MLKEIAVLHAKVLPHTSSSKKGINYLMLLYLVVQTLGYIKVKRIEGEIVGIISGIGPVILTLVVDPSWQRKGIGRELVSKLKGKRLVYTEECSVKFYEKMGFIKLGCIKGLYFLWRR